MYTVPRPRSPSLSETRGNSRRWALALAGLVSALGVLLAPESATACRRCDDFDFLCCDVPADGIFYLTSFDGEGMACGGQANGQWYYSTSWVRWSCGAHLQVTNPDNGECVVVEVADAGPADWVEENAGGPILDASPLVCRDLFGANSCGWSDHFEVEVIEVAEDTELGPGGCGPPLPDYDASYVGRDHPAQMTSGERAVAWIEFRNEGRRTWDLEQTQLATTNARDHASAFYDAENWLSVSRASGPDHSTYSTGVVGRFSFMVTAPEVAESTTIRETFGLVQGDSTWFGPEDAAIEIVVNPIGGGGGGGGGGDDGDADADGDADPGADGDSDADADADADAEPEVGGDADGEGDADSDPGFGGDEGPIVYSGATGSCSAAPRGDRAPSLLWLLLAAIAAMIGRRY